MEKDRNSVTIMLIRLNKKYKTEEIGSMAIGWERGFIIEKDETSRKYVNCKDCFYCDNEDKSCSKNNIYIPDIGYDYWKQCKYFVIDSQANDSKKIQAFKKKGVNVLKREKIKNPQDIYSIRKGSNYHFHNMRREYKEVFYSMYKKKMILILLSVTNFYHLKCMMDILKRYYQGIINIFYNQSHYL